MSNNRLGQYIVSEEYLKSAVIRCTSTTRVCVIMLDGERLTWRSVGVSVVNVSSSWL